LDVLCFREQNREPLALEIYNENSYIMKRNKMIGSMQPYIWCSAKDYELNKYEFLWVDFGLY